MHASLKRRRAIPIYRDSLAGFLCPIRFKLVVALRDSGTYSVPFAVADGHDARLSCTLRRLSHGHPLPRTVLNGASIDRLISLSECSFYESTLRFARDRVSRRKHSYHLLL